MGEVKDLEYVVRLSPVETVVDVGSKNCNGFKDPYTIKVYTSGLEPMGGSSVASVIVEEVLGVVTHLSEEVGYTLADFRKKQLKEGKTLEIKSKGNIYEISKGVN